MSPWAPQSRCARGRRVVCTAGRVTLHPQHHASPWPGHRAHGRLAQVGNGDRAGRAPASCPSHRYSSPWGRGHEAPRGAGAARRRPAGGGGPELTVELGEVVHQVGAQDLVLQQVLLVEEEDDRRVLEPGVGDDGPEQRLALLHAVLRARPGLVRPRGLAVGTPPASPGAPLTSLSDSTRTWSYSLRATRNMMDVTFSKQWIHFLRSDRCPPTSTILQDTAGPGSREVPKGPAPAEAQMARRRPQAHPPGVTDRSPRPKAQ